MSKINFGILGCANIAQRTMIATIQDDPNCEVLSVASRSLDKAKDVASKFNISHAESYDELVNNSYIDAIYIPLPIGMHKEWCLKAANNGKHIICEKSLSDNLADVQEILEAAKKNNIVLFENFMCDYHPQHEKVMDLIKNNQIGDIRNIDLKFGFPPLDENNIRYSKGLGGGALNDAGAYTLFMAQKLTELSPLSITCHLYNMNFEVDMMGSALLEFPGEICANLQFGFSHDYHNEYVIWGSKGTIKVNRAYSIPANFSPQITLTKNGKEESISCEAADHFKLLVSDFAKSIENKEYSLDKVAAQAKFMQAMRDSAKGKKTIYF